MYHAIVVGANGTASARAAVLHAADLARVTGAKLHVVHAFALPSRAAMAAPEMAVLTAGGDADATKAASELAEEVAAEARAVTSGDVEVHVLAGGAADALCSVATTVGADVIVVGNKGMKGARRVLGSVPNSVAHKAPCAVLVVPTC